MGLLVEILWKATFNNHFYKWKGKIFHQLKGGAIGLRLTGVCAKVVMDKLMDEFVRILESNGIQPFSIREYVDDMEAIGRAKISNNDLNFKNHIFLTKKYSQIFHLQSLLALQTP